MLRLNRTIIPVMEHASAHDIELAMLGLIRNAANFRASADLYVYAHDRKVGHVIQYDMRRMISWIQIAGTAGAIAAASFVSLVQCIKSAKAPFIKGVWNVAEYKAAKAIIREQFPSITAVRNVAAHPSEWIGLGDERERHSLRQPTVTSDLSCLGAGVTSQNQMHGLDDRLLFGSTFNGVYEEYELSAAKADALDEVVERLIRAFAPVSVAAYS